MEEIAGIYVNSVHVGYRDAPVRLRNSNDRLKFLKTLTCQGRIQGPSGLSLWEIYTWFFSSRQTFQNGNQHPRRFPFHQILSTLAAR